MSKKLFTSLLIAFALTSCDMSSNIGADGYQFGTPQYEKQDVKIKIVTYNTQGELLSAARAKGVNNPELVAFSELRPPNFDTCTVHMIKPSVEYIPEFIGHEFAHCVYGQWHTNNDSRS